MKFNEQTKNKKVFWQNIPFSFLNVRTAIFLSFQTLTNVFKAAINVMLMQLVTTL